MGKLMADTIVIEKDNSTDLSAVVSMINTALGAGGDILKELVRTAQSNPLVGIFVTLMLTDVASSVEIMGTHPDVLTGKPVKNTLLYPSSAAIIKAAIAAEVGITVTSQIVGVVGDLIPSITKTAGTASIIVPTATTLVNTDTRIDPAAAASLGKAKK
jgi:hypothetical protein